MSRTDACRMDEIDRVYTADEAEYLKAVDRLRRKLPFPSAVDLLRLAESLGWARVVRPLPVSPPPDPVAPATPPLVPPARDVEAGAKRRVRYDVVALVERARAVLTAEGPLTVTQLADRLRVGTSTVRRHLRRHPAFGAAGETVRLAAAGPPPATP